VSAEVLAVSLAEARDESAFGGKAVQLGASCRLGLPVPDGVALSAGLVDALVARDARAESTVESRLHALGGVLAVRSSAVGEDTGRASFAGQHTSRLGVSSVAQLKDAIVAVWRSGRSEAALAYRRRHGLEGEPRMGVVIQKLVHADVAGVLFTRNPVSDADELVIEAAWGLGEAVVQGLVVPDSYRLSRTGQVLDRMLGHKPIAIRADGKGGTIEERLDASRTSEACLDDAALVALSQLARRCDDGFGAPNDLEWAFSGGTLHLLQRRPITSRTK
jgi:pyruvate,water dikinase